MARGPQVPQINFCLAGGPRGPLAILGLNPEIKLMLFWAGHKGPLPHNIYPRYTLFRLYPFIYDACPYI